MDVCRRMVSLASGCVIAALSFNSAAADSLTFNGCDYSCTNKCVVTADSNGNWRIVDSGGGRVTWIISRQ